MGISSFFDRERLGQKSFHGNSVRVSFVSFVMHIVDAKFQEHCFNVSKDILYSPHLT